MSFLSSFLSIALLVIGFGFVIFWHELGHFLAAKWAGIRVEQFAVGMGPAVISWRRGIGFKFGSTREEYERRALAHLETSNPAGQSAAKRDYSEAQINQAADEIGLGETEYRLAWVPVGGYVKMLGQDDMNPTAQAEDPRAYNKKPVGKRMVVISAGVIMNVILAGILFMVLFMYGFTAPAPVVGNVLPNSPAQKAGLQVGDELLTYDGKPMHDFTKVILETALSSPTQDVKLEVRRAGTDKVETLSVRPQRGEPDAKSFITIGVTGSPNLTGPKALPEGIDPAFEAPEARLIGPGDVITAVNGIAVQAGDARKGTIGDYYILDRELQKSTPDKPLRLSVRSAQGQLREITVRPHFVEQGFSSSPVAIAGMQPRMAVGYLVSKQSPAYGKAQRGDAIAKVVVHGEAGPLVNPSVKKFIETMRAAGQAGKNFDIVFDHKGTLVEVKNAKAIALGQGRYGLGVKPAMDEDNTVVGDVSEGSAAAAAGIPAGSTIVSIDDKPVSNWFEIRSTLADGGPAKHAIAYKTPAGESRTASLAVDQATLNDLRAIRYEHHLILGELSRIRHTSSPLTALAWGTAETRDLILQFYVTLRRMITRDVSPSNLMGPVGIFRAGAGFAFKGTDWLIWFLAMISANLAVVNFLPIPIVDGGHFVFLCIEKIQGRPPSRRVLETAQLAGLLFIGFVFLFVTWNDIARIAGWQ